MFDGTSHCLTLIEISAAFDLKICLEQNLSARHRKKDLHQTSERQFQLIR
jgi:hypothetical protein